MGRVSTDMKTGNRDRGTDDVIPSVSEGPCVRHPWPDHETRKQDPSLTLGMTSVIAWFAGSPVPVPGSLRSVPGFEPDRSPRLLRLRDQLDVHQLLHRVVDVRRPIDPVELRDRPDRIERDEVVA